MTSHPFLLCSRFASHLILVSQYRYKKTLDIKIKCLTNFVFNNKLKQFFFTFWDKVYISKLIRKIAKNYKRKQNIFEHFMPTNIAINLNFKKINCSII